MRLSGGAARLVKLHGMAAWDALHVRSSGVIWPTYVMAAMVGHAAAGGAGCSTMDTSAASIGVRAQCVAVA